jgi:hypothetical protein
MTATERLFRGDKEEYLSMDDPRDYGDLIYQLSFKEAIEAKPQIIADYKIITFGISQPDIEAIYTDNKFIQIKKDIDDIKAREFATALALRKAIKKLGIKNAISFHSSIRRANNFKAQQELISKVYPEYGNLKAFHVSGDMPTNQRSSQMREFADSKGLMTNARCLTEGVDLPAIDCVVFTDPKKSKVDIVQAAGRALRLSPGKKFGYILIPLIIPENENATEAAKDTAFEEIVTTIRALATQDTRIIEYLRAVSSGTIPKGGSPVDGITKINVLTKVNEEEFNKSIQLKVWDRVAFGNWRPYEEAKKYAKLLKIKTAKEWRKVTQALSFPKDIRQHPIYYNEWKGWSEFLDVPKYTGFTYPEFNVLKKFIQTKKINNTKHYLKLWREGKLKTNFYVSARPSVAYKGKGWINWQDFLGSKYRSYFGNWRPYEEAKKYVQSLKIKNRRQWALHTKSKNFPNDIPKAPSLTYGKEYEGWGIFFGTGYIHPWKRIFRSYKEVKKYALSLKLKSKKEWYLHTKSKNFPKDIPVLVDYKFKKDFEGWDIFLGKSWRSYDEAKKYARSLKLKTTEDWKIHSKSKNFPEDIPKAPSAAYKEFESYGFFLGTGIIAPQLKKFRSYKVAKKYAQSLKLKSQSEWYQHTKSKNFPKDIRMNVAGYKEFEGMKIFLGNDKKSRSRKS